MAATAHRFYMMIVDGQLTAAVNRIKDDPVFDPGGGGLGFFSLELQRVGDVGPRWWGTSIRMYDVPAGPSPEQQRSLEVFESTVIASANLQYNTGASNVQIVVFRDDELPAGPADTQFSLALLDETTNPADGVAARKPWVLERVPEA